MNDYRPFNAAHHQAGAPIRCRDTKYRPEILKTIGGRTFGLIHRECDPEYPTMIEWDAQTGRASLHNVEGPHDLVMAPLFSIEGKGVFVGDHIVGDDGIVTNAHTFHRNAGNHHHWRWPRPDGPVVKTKMTDRELHQEWDRNPEYETSLRQVANISISRALSDGQVITQEAHEDAMHKMADAAWCYVVQMYSKGGKPTPSGFSAAIGQAPKEAK